MVFRSGGPGRIRAASCRVQAGYTYLLVLFLVAGLGVLAAQTGVVWHRAAQRDRETELLFIGTEFSRALASYAKASGDQTLPETLEQLVEDKRGPVVVRHLRKIYRDPFTGLPTWGLERSGGRISGVYSLATGEPIRRHALPAALGQMPDDVKSYAQWIFRPLVTAEESISGVGGASGEGMSSTGERIEVD